MQTSRVVRRGSGEGRRLGLEDHDLKLLLRSYCLGQIISSAEPDHAPSDDGDGGITAPIAATAGLGSFRGIGHDAEHWQ
jgi:hypothetical protein